jgi:hypothetical protein
VPADEDEGAGGDVHYMTVEQDPDKVWKFVCLLVPTKASPGLFINLCVSLNFWIIIVILCACTFRSWIETLVVWSLSTNDLLLAC